MQRVRHDELDVVDAGPGGELEDVLHHPAPDVRRLHRRQRQRDVVEGDGEAHTPAQQAPQRLPAGRMLQGMVDGGIDVLDPRQGLRGVDDPAAEGQAFEAEPLAVMEQQRRRPLVDLQDKTRSCHKISFYESNYESSRGSKTTLMLPRRPADMAWSTASRKRDSG